MFEHFGFLDAVCAVKKFFIVILAVALVFCAVGFGYANSKNNEIKSADYVPVKKIDVSISELFLVSAVMTENSTIKQAQANSDVSWMLASLLSAEHTRQSVYEAVLEEIKAEELMASKTSLHDKYANKIVTNEIISEFVTIQVLDKTSVLRINVNTENEKLAEMLLELYKKQLDEAIELVKASNIECTYSNIEDSKIGTESERTINPPTVAGEVSVVKYVIIYGILGVALSLCLVFVWALFVPVINRRSDIEGYDTRVIVDKKESIDFALNNIKRRTDSGKVAFVICRGKSDKRKGEAYFEKINPAMAEQGIELTLCYNVASDFAEFTKACGCGRAIIAVSCSNTKHKEYQKTVARLRDNDVQILGSVIV